MADAERKISLRFTDEEFVALEDKRHALRTTFQAVGHESFLEWLSSAGSAGERADSNGEFVKCPAHLRELVQTMIVRLHAMDSAMLPAMEKLLIRFSEPGAIEDILSAEGRRALLGPRAVSSKK
jgi:hypothetical protein